MADPARLAATTINKYLRGEENEIMRNRKILASIQDRGGVSYNHSGLLLDYKVRYRRAPMTGFTDGDTLTFAKQNRWRTAQLPWRGYTMTDQITDFEKEKNKGAEAIVKIYSEMATSLIDDMTNAFGDEPYIDGNAAANVKRFHGIESFMGNTGTPGTKQPIGVPSDTYAGILTDLGNYSGSWSATGSTTHAVTGDWPTGTGTDDFDFWSPLLVDYTSAVATSAAAGTTGWAASTKTWPNTCLEATRYGITNSQKNKSKKGMLDLITFEGELFRLFKDKCQAEEQIMVMPGADDGLRKLGFKDVINFDGIDITSEFGIPRGVGYGWNMDCVEINSMLDVLFRAKSNDYDLSSTATRFALFCMGNFRFRAIRTFVKFAALT